MPDETQFALGRHDALIEALTKELQAVRSDMAQVMELMNEIRGGAKVGLAVDADGRFEGALPADGKWQVRAKSVRARFEKEMEVEVPRPETTREGRSLPSFVDAEQFAEIQIKKCANLRSIKAFTFYRYSHLKSLILASNNFEVCSRNYNNFNQTIRIIIIKPKYA